MYEKGNKVKAFRTFVLLQSYGPHTHTHTDENMNIDKYSNSGDMSSPPFISCYHSPLLIF